MANNNDLETAAEIQTGTAGTADAASAPKLISTSGQTRVPFAVIEAYKNIRVNLLSMITEQEKNVICFTSPNAAEGKSTSSINVAIAISQLNKRVILIDADAHRPTIHSKLKIENKSGTLNILGGDAAWKDVVYPYNPHLDVLTIGFSSCNSAELFSSEAFGELLAELKTEYDYVIVDTPPINLVSDSLIISQKCDVSVLVIRSDVTTHQSLKSTLSSLKLLKINILGVILNGVGAKRKKYYKYSRYSKYSKYSSYRY